MVRLSKLFKKKKNLFEASMPIDKPEIKVVEARYNNKPFLLAVGTSKQREVKGAGEVGTEGVKAEYQQQKDLDWNLLYSPKVFPDFIPIEKLKDLMASTVSVVSGSSTVVTSEVKFAEIDQEKLEQAKKEESIRSLISTDSIHLEEKVEVIKKKSNEKPKA